MTQLVSKRLIRISDIETVLEDSAPELQVDKVVSSPNVEAEIRIKMASNIGAKINLSVQNFHFGHETLQKLAIAGIETSLIDGIRQSNASEPVPADKLRSHLTQILGSEKADELLRHHQPAIREACGFNSRIIVSDWDPNEFIGLFSGGNAFYMSHRFTFRDELSALLTDKLDLSPDSSSAKSDCFIATAASGNPNDHNVDALRTFRDDCLSQSQPGRFLMRCYSAVGPTIAKMIRRSRLARRFTYIAFVRPCAFVASYFVRASSK